MAESLASQFLSSDTEVGCPVCRYRIWVTWDEIAAQAAVLCPCCRTRAWLRDAEGSAQYVGRAIDRIDQALKGFQR